MITLSYLTLIRPRLNSRNKTELVSYVSHRTLTMKLESRNESKQLKSNHNVVYFKNCSQGTRNISVSPISNIWSRVRRESIERTMRVSDDGSANIALHSERHRGAAYCRASTVRSKIPAIIACNSSIYR